MKASNIMAYVGVLGLAALGVAMTKTNPSQVEYEEYAVQRLTEYLNTSVCKKTPKFLENVIQFNCRQVVDSAQPQLREIIADSTVRQDFIIFSIYRTDLNVNSLIPALRLDSILPSTPGYQFETLGAFNQFYTYKAEQQ
ncbi:MULTISPECIES: DUF4359 domain-containing protein [Fischerella]|jgi:hypothetical protein|uniref:DUF4359 domain-containing protein n=1 Tax=Fischerella muscicola CCMEE 5323 TaxID=2019572 RepID=A0A2N6JYH1_FISMU|nr:MULTISPECIES: DUF4359 domain-containing protein [Fischerella]MBD2430106.1 DUF4359 domain-containing protein [Fischerella sp. FACHB-380]PLZ85907.1 DUF4359 domain-containing protein [Fischerella muscicola CCMEE 5323]